MDDLSLLVILFLVATGIFYLIGHPYWWIILFSGGTIFVIGIYLVGTYDYNTSNINNTLVELSKIKEQINTMGKII